jgi:PAS domain S-box-containing protein
MDARPESAVEEAARLRRCLNDLVGVMALPAVWAGDAPVRIVGTLLEALLGMLGVSFTFARLNEPSGGTAKDTLRVSDGWSGAPSPAELGASLHAVIGQAWPSSPPGAWIRLNGEQLWVTGVPLGIQGQLGVVVAGSIRVGFPEQTERLILEVAANQAAVALQQARLLDQQTEERRRAEEALRDSEREALLIVDTIPGLVALLAPTGGVDVANAQLLEYFGQSLDELRHWGANGTVHPDDLAHVAETFTRSVAAGEPYDIQQRLRRRDGSYRWMQNRGIPLRARTGAIVRWCVLLTDIDDQKQAENALRESERSARLIVDSIPGLVVVLSQSGEVEFVSRRTVDYLGPELADTGGWASNGIVHPEDVPRVVPLFGRGVASGLPFEYEVRLRHLSGIYRWFLLRAHPLRDTSGDVARWYVLLSDIEDRRRTEEELRRSEVFLAEGQRISQTGTFAWQVDTDELTFSEELRRIFEFEDDAAVTVARITDRVYVNDRPALAERIAEIRAGRDSPEYEIRLQMADLRLKHARVFGRVFRHDNGRLECVGAVQDVTQRRLAENARDAMRTELGRVTRAMSLSTLTASVAHEINQPLSGIITNASACLRMLGVEPPDIDGARDTARRTIRDGNRASDIVTRLRSLFGNRQFEPDVLDINEAAREVIELSLVDLRRNDVVVQIELDETLPAVTGDRVQLQQVLLNLLRNASDAMAGVEDRARQIVIRTRRDAEGSVRVTVRDAGQGLDPKHMDRLFDPFYTTKDEGMGIGLSVSRSIIENHNGRLWAESNDGQGATFAFSIPLHPEAVSDTVSKSEGPS